METHQLLLVPPYGKPQDEISILKKLRQDVWDFPEVPAEGWLVFF
jgi:hypothetical protein